MSRPIVAIATAGITIGIAVMIVSLAVVTGFQQEIQKKMIGFGAHVQINSISLSNNRETSRVPVDQEFYPFLDTVPGIRHIQIYATKAGVIETKDNIQGVMLKGVGPDMDTGFFKKHLVKGRLLELNDTTGTREVLLSKYLADRLQLEVEDELTVYLFKGREDIRPRKFTLVGIYETGLEQFDKEFAITDIHHIRRINNWGLDAEIYLDTTCVEGGVKLTGLAFGGDGTFDYEWKGINARGKGPHLICLDSTQRVELIVHDRSATVTDTATIEMAAINQSPCACGENIRLSVLRTGNSYKAYVGGFEVFLEEDVLDLVLKNDSISRVELSELLGEHEMPRDLYVSTVREQYPELFAWLELLDTNVIVIIVLMIVVAVINMTSALLIMILERTNMIGVLKALGSSDGSIKRIFLYNSGFTIFKGVLLGTGIGLLLCYIQHATGIVTLPQENYYVSVVPVKIEWEHILVLDLFTLTICLAVLILPSMLITRIAPVRAIRFD